MKTSVNVCFRYVFLPALMAGVLLMMVPAQETGKQAEPKKGKSAERFSDDEKVSGAQKDKRSLTDADRDAGRQQLQSEVDAAIQPYLNNSFDVFRMGPEDKVSVLVFNQERYSMPNVTIPPDGRLNYPLIGMVKVTGRTSEDVEKEIAEKLSEYIIEPKVTVQVVEAHSMKFMVLGDVANPGPREMSRRMRVSEAIAVAGDITQYGDRSKVRILRLNATGRPEPILVNMKQVQSGLADDIYLAAGDVVVVPGNKLKTIEKVMRNISLVSWMQMMILR
ncbi:MAG: polysaccharide biosynthesis/export family protein [Blastocatellia bacterium]